MWSAARFWRKKFARVRESIAEELNRIKMKKNDVKDWMGGFRKRVQRVRWRCPNELQLAAYVDRRLDGKARESLEAHLADCDLCLDQVSFLVHSAAWADSVDVPAQLLTRAKNLVSDSGRPPLSIDWGWAATAVAVACLVLAFAIVLALRLHGSEPTQSTAGPLVAQDQPQQHPAAIPQFSTTPQNRDAIPSSNTAPSDKTIVPRPVRSAPLVRNAEPGGHLPKLTFPHDGAVVKREKLEFRWQTVSDAIFYEVSIVTAAGDPVIVRQTDGTRLELRPDVQLISGAKYFVSVRAHLRDGKTARSSVVSFKVVD